MSSSIHVVALMSKEHGEQKFDPVTSMRVNNQRCAIKIQKQIQPCGRRWLSHFGRLSPSDNPLKRPPILSAFLGDRPSCRSCERRSP